MRGVGDLASLPSWGELLEPTFSNDPGSVYRAAHRQPGPGIFRMANGDGIAITAFDTLAALSGDPALGAQNRNNRAEGSGSSGALARLDANSPFFMNEPVHTPMAAAVYQPLSPACHGTLTETVKAAATDAADRLLANGGGDLVDDFAMAIAVAVWLELTGAPASAAPQLRQWSASVKPMLGFATAPSDIEWANQCAADSEAFFEELYTRSTSGLFENLHAAIQRCPHADAPKSAAAMVAAMNFDAIDSVAAATANALYLCLSDPNRWQALQCDPACVPLAWREAIRLEPSVIGLHRGALRELTVAGVTIPSGTNVLMVWAAGNRDPTVFDEPDVFDMHRDSQRGMSFGGGPRICKGRHLAMLQGQIALEILLERTKGAELFLSTPRWSPPGMIRGVERCDLIVQ